MASSKLKTLYIFKFLNDYTDENNPLSTTELIDMLSQVGIKTERKSIYSDVKILNQIGFDIVSTRSPKKGFFMAHRQFQLSEVRLLIDAVSSAGFITPKKTEELAEKLESLVSKNQAQELASQVYIDSNTKCSNEEIYYVIDTLHDAIIHGNKVSFIYNKRDIDVENKKSYTEKRFKVSPYALLWKEDHYYLVCNNEKYDNVMNLRLDRMKHLKELDEPCRDMSEVTEYRDTFDVSDYSSKMFNMFSGKTEKVTILCDLDMREQIMDRFGAKVPLTAADSKHFKTTVDAAVSDGLASWIMKFGNKIKVLEPQSLAVQIKEKALSIAELYND
ncbi:YafY family protein [uncultured Eubacterium sp.]|uniref:helix-turn-helix transcriptional regulator n=1 Tax=uncultured Eubacterium sp. TaxID=165185 RepID=UPI0015A8377C|nr:WYL domain-containing protein [uncultured Eubacterium sp.]